MQQDRDLCDSIRDIAGAGDLFQSLCCRRGGDDKKLPARGRPELCTQGGAPRCQSRSGEDAQTRDKRRIGVDAGVSERSLGEAVLALPQSLQHRIELAARDAQQFRGAALVASRLFNGAMN